MHGAVHANKHVGHFLQLPLQRRGFNSATVVSSLLGTKLYRVGNVCRWEASEGSYTVLVA